MDKTVIEGSSAPEATGRTAAEATAAGDWVFVSGQRGTDGSGELVSAEFVPQVRKTLENLEAVLTGAGSTPDDVVYVAAWVTDPRYIDRFEQAFAEFMGTSRAARSVVGTRSLALPGQLVEIEARALRSDASTEKRIVEDTGLPTVPDDPSYAPVVRAGEWIYLGGQLGVHRDFTPVSRRFGSQIDRIYENVAAGLAAAGSSLADMMHTTTSLTDLRDTQIFHHTRDEVLEGDHTTSTRVGMTDLRDEALRVEMECTAVTSALGKTNVTVPDFPVQTIEKDGDVVPRHWPVATAGEWVWTAGAVPRTEGVTGELVSLEFEDQARKAFENMDAMLHAAGSSLEDVLHVRVYLRDMRYAEAFERIRGDVISGEPHASSLVQTAALGGNPGRLLELDGALAVIPS